MSNIINVILVVFLLVALLIPFILIPIVLCYNSIVKKYQRKAERDTKEDTARGLIRILKFGPLLKYDKKFELFIETFNKINKSKKISIETKKELYNILTKKGCKIEGTKFNK